MIDLSQISSPKLPSQSSLCPRQGCQVQEPPSWWLPSSVHPGIPSSLSGPPLSSLLPQIFWFPCLPCEPGSCLQSYLTDHSNIRVGSRSTSQIVPALNTHAILRSVSLLPVHIYVLWTHAFLWSVLEPNFLPSPSYTHFCEAYSPFTSFTESICPVTWICIVWLPASHFKSTGTRLILWLPTLSSGHMLTRPVSSRGCVYLLTRPGSHIVLQSLVNQTRFSTLGYNHLWTNGLLKVRHTAAKVTTLILPSQVPFVRDVW